MRNIAVIFPLRFFIFLSLIFILVFSGESEAKEAEWSYSLSSSTYKAELSADGRYIAVGSNDGIVRLLDTHNHTELWSYDTGSISIRNIDVSADGSYVVAGEHGNGSSAKIYLFDKDLTDDQPLWEYQTLASYIHRLEISADGSTIAAQIFSNSELILVFDVSSNSPLWTKSVSSYNSGLDISADGTYVYYTDRRDVGDHQALRVHSRISSTPLWVVNLGEVPCCYDQSDLRSLVSVSADGQSIAVARQDSVFLFDIDSEIPVWTYNYCNPGCSGIFRSVAISEDGSKIAAGHDSGKTFLFNSSSSTPFWISNNGGFAVELSGDGQYLVANQHNCCTAYFWNTSSSTPLETLSNKGRYGVDMSIDGYYYILLYNNYVHLVNNTLSPGLYVLPYSPSNESSGTNPADLSWMSAYNGSTSLKFDVYLDTSSNPTTLVASNLTASNYTTSLLNQSLTFYWKIVAKGANLTASSEVYKFKPNAAPEVTLVSPKNSRRWYSTSSVVLEWSGSDADGDELTYLVYFESCSTDCDDFVPTNLVHTTKSTTYTKSGVLSNNSRYYWMVKATDGINTTASSVWQFTVNQKEEDWKDSTGSGGTTAWVSVSGDGRFTLVGAAGSDDKVMLFDYDEEDEEVWTYSVGSDVSHVAMSKDGKYFAFTTGNGDTSTEYRLFVYRTNATDSSTNPVKLWEFDVDSCIRDLVISADGGTIAFSDCLDWVRAFDVGSNSAIWQVQLENPYYIAMSADGQTIAVGDTGTNILYLYNIGSTTPLWKYGPFANSIRTAAISANGEFIAVGDDCCNSPYRRGYVFHRSSNVLIGTTNELDSYPGAFEFSDDGKYLLASSNQRVAYYSVSKSGISELWSVYYNGDCCSAYETDVSADGSYLVVTRREGTSRGIYFFGKDSGTPLWSHNEQPNRRWLSTSISDSGRVIAAGTDYASKNFHMYSWEYAPTDFLFPVSPADNSLVTRNVTIHWAVDGEDAIDWTYDIYLSTNSSLSTATATNLSDRNYKAVNLTPGATYYWKVVTKDGDATVLTSDINQFQVQAATSVTLETPFVNYTRYVTAVDLLWKGSDGLQYLVYLGTSVDELTAQSTTWKTSNTLTVSGLSVNTTYYWKVRAFDGSSFVESPVRTFEIAHNSGLWTYSTTSTYATVVAISDNGNYSVVGYKDGKVKLFSKNNNTPLWSYSTGNEIFAVDISSDGEYIVAGSKNEKAYLFRYNSSSYVWRYDVEDDVYAASISSDGEYIAVGGKNSKLFFFEGTDGDPLWTSDELEGDIVEISISSDGGYIAVGTDANSYGYLYLFSKDDAEPVWVDTALGVVASLEIDSDGTNIALASEDYYVYYYSTSSSSSIWEYDTGNKAMSVSLSSDGNLLAAGSQNKYLYFFNTSSSQPLWSALTGAPVSSISLTPDGSNLAVASGKQLYFFNKNSLTFIWRQDTLGSIQDIAISSDSYYILMGDKDTLGDGLTKLYGSPYLKKAYINSTLSDIVKQYENVTFQGYAEDSSNVTGYYWTSTIDGLLSTNLSFTTDSLSPGNHTITLQAQYNGSDSHVVETGPQANSDTKYIWRLDEGTGSTAYDSSDNGFNGNIYNSPSWIEGRFGSCLDFDGSNEYVRSPGVVSSVPTEFTIEMWIYLNSDPSSTKLLYESGRGVMHLYLQSNNKIQFRTESGNGYGSEYAYSTTTLTTGVWYHVAATYSGSDDELKVYVNGTLEDTESTNSAYTLYNWGYYDSIGGYAGWGSSSYFDGKIDEVHRTHRVLTAFSYNKTVTLHKWSHPALVSLRVNAPPTISVVSINPIISQQYGWMGDIESGISNVDLYTKGYWPFEEGAGSMTYDQTAYDYDMYLVSTSWVSSGKFGKALDFEYGSDSYLYDYRIGRGEDWEEFTIEAWVRQESMPDSNYPHYIASAYNPVRFWLYIDQDGYVNFDFDRYTTGSSVNRVYLDSNAKIGVNEWKHVAATINITSGEAKIYIDGNLDLTQSFTVGSNGLYNGDCCYFLIGGYIYDTNNYNFDGKIDEVRLTKKALTTSEFILGSSSAFNASFSVSASDSDGSIVNYTWNSDVDGIIGYNSYLSLNVTSKLSLGYHNITVKATDNEGNSVTSSATMIRIKGIPVVNITTISRSSTVEGTNITFNATATDIDGPIAVFQWKSSIDGQLSYSQNFSTTSLSPGYHNIIFRARDLDDYWSFWDNETVFVNDIPAVAGTVTPEVSVQGDGFDLSQWRKARTITLSNGTPSSNYIITITLNTTNFDYSHTAANGSDLRFTDNSYLVTLSHYIFQWNSLGESIVLVEVPTQNTTSFKILYDNPNASASSDPTILEIAEDFTDTDFHPSIASISYNNTISQDGFACFCNDGSSSHHIRVNLSQDSIVVFRQYSFGDSDDYFRIGTTDVSPSDQGFPWTKVVFTVRDGYQHITRGSYSWSWSYGVNFPTYVEFGDVDSDSGGFCMDDLFVVPYSSTINITIGSEEISGLPTSNYTALFNSTVTNLYGTITNYTWHSSKDGYLNYSSDFGLNVTQLTLGNHTLSLKVKDGYGIWSPWYNFTHHVRRTPTVASMTISDSHVDQSDRVFFNGTGSDIDGTITQYSWHSTIDGLFGNQSSINLTTLSPGNHTISFMVGDNTSLWSIASTDWIYVNDQPIATIDSVSAKLVYTNGSFAPDKPEIDSNTIHMWRLDEGSGSSTSDNGSYDWSANLNNGPTWVTGKSGHALEFDGDNDYAQSTSSTSSHNGEVTIEAWIYFDTLLSNEKCIYSWGAGVLIFCINSNEKLYLKAYSSNGYGYAYLTGSTALSNSTWYHVAATFSESNDVMKVYVNGVEDGTFSIHSSYELYHWGANSYISYDAWWGGRYFEGIIDEVRVSNVARTAFNIPDNITFNGSATDQSGYVAAYSWTSSIDNLLSTQANFTIHESNLSFGNHTITFKAQDETGAWSVPKTTNITVRSFPYARITSVEPWYVNVGTQVNFTATALAPDSNLTGYLWWSSIDGNLNTNLSFNSTSLSYGNHTILFKAKNERGEWSQPYFANDGVSFVLVNDIPAASINDMSPNPATKGEGRAPPVDQYTIGYWPFRESTGTETIDESGQNNNATLKGSQFESGVWDSSVYFDGSSDYLYVTEGDALSDLGGGDFTLEAWIYPTRSMTSGTHSIIRNDGDYNLFVSNGHLKAEVWFDGDRYWKTSDETYMSSTNTWYHIAAVWDSDDLEWTLYINGEPQDSNSNDNSETVDDYPLWFGSTERYSDQAFKGKIDEVRISSIERSSSSLLYYTTLQSTIVFEGSGSDGDGTIEGYNWKSSFEGLLSTDKDFSLTAANFTVAIHTISYRVQDDDGVWSPWATSSLDVRSYPTSQILSISPNSTSEGLSVTFTGNASDPDSSETFVTYRWWSSIDGWLGDSRNFSYSDWSPGNHTIYLQVKDSQGYWSMPVSGELFINDVPTASIDSITPNPAYNNNATYTTVTFNGTVLDADGSISAYSWSSNKEGTLSTSSDFVINVNQLGNGNHTITFRGKDDYGAWSPNVTTYLEVFENPNATIDSVSATFVNQYAKLWLNGTGSDNDGSVTNYTWTSSIDGLIGTFEDISLSTLTPGNHTITFKVKDNSTLWSTGATTNVEINARPIVSLEATIPTTIYGFSGSTLVQGPDDDTLAFWHLDEATGDTAYDSSSSEKHGTLKNSPSWETGLYQNALEFDGSDDYVEVPELLPGDVFDVVTIEAWIKLKSDVDEDDEWIVFAGGKDGLLKFGINDEEEPFIFVDETDNFDSKTVTSSQALVHGYWYHLAGIYDSDNDLIQIYLNHQMVANSSIEANYVLDRAATAKNTIGSSTGGSQDFFYGTIDELRISDIKRNTSDMVSRSDASYILAFASDADDNIESMKWRSSIDGILSTSNWFLLEASDLQAGSHNITFRAKDPHGFWSEYINFTLNVKMYPRASITSISPNSTNVGTTITFTATSSDSDGSVVAYKWRSSKDGALSTSENFTRSSLSAGYHRITYQVKDNEGLWSVIETSEIFLNEIPTAFIGSIEPQTVYRNNLTYYTASFYGNVSDNDGSITHYYWNSSKDGVLSTSGNFTVNVNTLSLGNHTITFQGRDNYTTWSPKVSSWLVVKAYPNATITSVTPRSTDEGASVSFTGSGSDEDGTITGYEWMSSKDGLLSTSSSFSTTGLSTGFHRIYFKVKDNDTLWSVAEISSVFINDISVASIGSINPQTVYRNNLTYYSSSFYGNVSDNDGSITHYYWNSSKDGTLSQSGNFTVNVNTLSLGTHTITFQGRDNYTTWSPKVSTWFIVKEYPNATITSVSPRSTDEGVSVSFSGSGSDEDGTISGYEWMSSRAGLLNRNSSFSTTDLSPGFHRIYFKVKDNDTLWSVAEISSVFINDIPEASIDTVGSNPVYKNNQTVTTVSINGSGEDKDGQITHYYWNSSKNGVLSTSGNFTTTLSGLSVGNHTIYLQVRDNYTSWSPSIETWLIVKAYPNATISSVSPTFTNESDEVTFSGTGSDEDGNISGYEWTSSIDGLIGTLSGFTLDSLSPGNHTIYFKVKDNDSLWSTVDTTSIVVNGRPVVDIIAIVPSIIFGYSGNDTLPASDSATLGYWHMDEDSGTRANDASSNLNHATLKNGAAWGSGLFGGGVELDGDNDYILVPDMLGGSSVFTEATFEVWTNLDSSVSEGEDMVIFSGGQDGLVEIGIDDDQYAYFKVNSGSFGWKEVTSNMTVAPGAWYHIAALYSESDDFIKIYINRQLVGVYDLPTNFVLSKSISAKNCVGAGTSGSSICTLDNFQGNVDEFRISTSIRSVDSLISLYDTTFLSATAFDYENSITDLVWISSIDGAFSYDQSLSINATTLSPGNHTLTFGAKDNYGFWSHNATAPLYVRHHPRSSIESTSHISTDENVLITFVGEASDTDGSITSYEWHSSRDGVFGTSLNITTGILSAGHHVISFKVKDNDDLWSITEYVSLFINDIPTAAIGSLSQQIAYKNNLTYYNVNFYGNVSDNDGSITHYYWNSSKDGTLSQSGNFTVNVNTLSLGNHTITFQGRDNYTTWSPKVSAWLVVKAYPNATITSVSPRSTDEGVSVSFSGSGSDEDGNITGYEWISSRDGLLSRNSSFSTTGLSTGFHRITFKVKDNDTLWSVAEISSVFINDISVASIGSIEPQTVYRNNLTYYTASFYGNVSDNDGSITHYYWNSSKDGVLSISGNFTVNVNTLSLGNHTITFQGRDNYTTWSPKVSTWLVVKEYPNATITSVSPRSMDEGVSVSFTGSGSDEDGTITGYEWISSRDGLLSRNSSFSTTELSTGFHRIYFKVKDSDTLWSMAKTSSVFINAISVASISSIDPQIVYRNNLTYYTASFYGNVSDNDGQITHYYWNSSKDGTLSQSGNFTVNVNTLSLGTHTITFQGRDNYTTWSPKVSTWLVVKAYPNATITFVSDTFSNETQNVEFQGSGSDEDGTIEKIEWTSSIDGILSNYQNFNITTLSPGNHIINLRVKDNDSLWSRSDSFNLAVNGKPTTEIIGTVPNVIFEFSENSTLAHPGEATLGFWHFDEEGGTKAFDSSDNQKDADLQNGPIYSGGLFGNSVELDGDDDYLSLPKLKSGVSVFSEVTFETWIYSNNPVGSGEKAIIFSGGRDGTLEFGIDDDQHAFVTATSQAITVTTATSQIIAEDRWYHLAFVYSDEDDFIKIYINHELAVTSALPSTFLLQYNLGYENRIGAGFGSTIVNAFDGRIDEFKITESILAPDELIYGYDIAYFSADSYDFEDSIINAFWYSSIDGLFSAGYWWQWNSTTSTALSLGNHTITFRVQDGYGYWSDNATSFLEIKAHPQSNISSVSSNSFDYGTSLYLEGMAEDKDGNVSAFEWKSDIDGIISTSLSTGPIILSPGDHNINFKVKDDDGLWSISKTVSVHVNDIPYVSIDFINPNPAYKYTEIEQIITFVGTASDNDGFITDHIWTSSLYGVIGRDNITSISANNLSVGNHSITYKSKDDFGTWSEEVFTQLEIRSHPLSDIFNVTPSFQAEDQPVQFDGGGTDEDGIVVGYEWYSSLDGLIGVLPTFNITDLSSGNHTISLRVTDDDGLWSDYDTTYVLINSRPKVELINSIPELVYAYGPDHELPSANVYTLGYWHFDSIDDNKVNDSSFNSHHASVQGNPTRVGGLFNSSLALDGTIDSFSTPQLLAGEAFDEVTIEAWVYLDQNYVFDRNRVIFAGGWDGRLEVGIGANHKAYITVYSDTIGTFQLSSDNELNKLQWYHVAAVYSEQNDQMVLYINGKFDRSVSLPEQFDLGRSGLVENCIGAIAGCSAGNFIGLIDEVRITNALLYPEQFLYRPDRAYISAIVVDYDSQVTGGEWKSDLDGLLGTDLWLSKDATDLSPGLHNLTFRAVDEYDVWSINYTTQIYVSTYPVVTNLSIESTYEYPVDQEMIWLNGSVSDYDGGSLINFQWFSSIDGNLGEALTTNKRLSSGTHEIRFRAQDNEGHWSAWNYSYYYVDVHPIHDVQTESDEIYRGFILPISFAVGDNSTLPSQFSVEIEINVTASNWSNQSMVQPIYNGTLWEAFFGPGLDMQPGFYQVRGRTTRDETRTTPWIHLFDIEVLNNAPVIRDVIFSNTTLQRNQESSLKLNITDLEAHDNLSVLDVHVFYFDKLEEDWLPGFFSDIYFNESSGLFEVDVLPPRELKVGKYDLKLEVTDLDGELVTLTQDNAFTVINSLPIVQQLETEILDHYDQGNSTFWLNVTGEDFDGDIFRYEWFSSRQGPLPCTTSNCELDPKDLSPGIHEISVYAVDEDGELSEPLRFEIVVNEVATESEGAAAIIDFVIGNPFVLGGTILAGLLLVGSTLFFRKGDEVFVEEEFEDVLPRDPVQAWLPPLELNDYEVVLAEFFVKRRESYLAYPSNEEILDFLHNNRERYAISSYFEVPTSPTELLQEWALPANLRYNVHLDDVRKSIVNTILDDTAGTNFVIIGEPGVGKSVIGFDVFDRLMDQMPVGRITTFSIGNVHEKFGIRLFYDDIPENPELIQVLQKRKIKGLVVTAREADWRSLPRDFQNMFERLTVPLFPEDEMLNLASRMLAFSGLLYEPQALDKLAVYSEGSPIYVWSLIRELISKDIKKLTLTYLSENSMKGMTNYVSLLLQQLLKDAGEYKSGGYHTLSAVNFLSTHMAEKNSHELFFRAFSEQLSEHTKAVFNDEMDTMTFNHAMGYLSGEGSQVRFPHDTWADVLEGEGSMNPFRAEIQTIVQEFSDTGIFETVKREAVPKAWKTAVSRYEKSPSRQHEALLALADTLFRNFGVKDLKKLGVDSDLVLEVATTYSHLPLAAMLVSKIQAATPQQVTKIINIQDTVSEQKSFGDISSHPPYTMEELYLLYNDGRLIASKHSRKAKVDSDIMSSMLTAINDFVKDSFQTEGNLGAIDYGENKIILERGDNTVLGAVIYGEATRDLRSKMGAAVRTIEDEYAEILASWNGDVGLLAGTSKILAPLIDLTAEVTRDMIEDYLSMQEVRMRSSSNEFQGFLEAKANINNYASKSITDVVLGLDYNKSKLKLIKVLPEYKHDVFKVNVEQISGYSELELKLYFDVLDKKKVGLSLRLDYTNPRGEGSRVSSIPCDGINFETSVKKPKREDLDPEEEVEVLSSPVEESTPVELDIGKLEVPISEVEEEVEEKVEEPVDLGESGMDDLLDKLSELSSEDSSEEKEPKKSKKKPSDDDGDFMAELSKKFGEL